jgi:gas vesicle protein
MNYDKGISFIGGLLLGGIVGATVALLMAPASGEDTRYRIRSEGVALKHRGQEYGNDRIHDAQKMVKEGQKGVSSAIDDTKDNLRVAMGAGK